MDQLGALAQNTLNTAFCSTPIKDTANAYYSDSIANFIYEGPNAILGQLAAHHPHDLDALLRNAWLAQISILQRELASLDAGWLAFEFAIPRMGKRADNVILFGGVIFVLEFKVGTERFDNAARDQVVDYALDLKNFHSGSHELLFVVARQFQRLEKGY